MSFISLWSIIQPFFSLLSPFQDGLPSTVSNIYHVFLKLIGTSIQHKNKCGADEVGITAARRRRTSAVRFCKYISNIFSVLLPPLILAWHLERPFILCSLTRYSGFVIHVLLLRTHFWCWHCQNEIQSIFKLPNVGWQWSISKFLFFSMYPTSCGFEFNTLLKINHGVPKWDSKSWHSGSNYKRKKSDFRTLCFPGTLNKI